MPSTDASKIGPALLDHEHLLLGDLLGDAVQAAQVLRLLRAVAHEARDVEEERLQVQRLVEVVDEQLQVQHLLLEVRRRRRRRKDVMIDVNMSLRSALSDSSRLLMSSE